MYIYLIWRIKIKYIKKKSEISVLIFENNISKSKNYNEFKKQKIIYKVLISQHHYHMELLLLKWWNQFIQINKNPSRLAN